MSTRYFWFKLVTFLSMTLPRPVLYWVAFRLADFNHRFDRRGREAVRDNLRVILGPQAPEEKVRFETRWVFRNFGKVLAEFFGYKRFGTKFLDMHLDVIGLEYLHNALKAGKGAVVNTAHISNWEIGAAFLAHRGYDMLAVAQMHPEADVNELFSRQRASRGYHVMPVEGAFRRCIQGLRENKVVCFVGERNIGEGGTEVKFMGRKSLFPQGPARIALAAGAPLIPSFTIRRPNDSFTIIVHPPVHAPDIKDKREAAHLMTQEFADIVAGYIRKFPAQWGVFFKAWADGEPLSPEDEEATQRPVWGRGTSAASTASMPIASPEQK